MSTRYGHTPQPRPAPQPAPVCVHRWRYGEPNGPTVTGTCSLCGVSHQRETAGPQWFGRDSYPVGVWDEARHRARRKRRSIGSVDLPR